MILRTPRNQNRDRVTLPLSGARWHHPGSDYGDEVIQCPSADASARSTVRSSLIDRSSRRTRTPSTTSERLDELVVAAPQPWLLVGVDLAHGGGPVDPFRRVVVDQDAAIQGDPTGQLEGGAVEYHQIDPRREQHLKCRWRVRRPPGRDVDIGVRTRQTSYPATVQQPEPSPGTTQHRDDLNDEGVRRGDGQDPASPTSTDGRPQIACTSVLR